MTRLAAALGVMALAGWTGPVLSQEGASHVIGAEYIEPTTRYDHGVLGDAIEWGALRLTLDKGALGGRHIRIRLPEHRVFEDVAPRLVDLDGDMKAEVIVVESDVSLGARLAIYDQDGVVAATPFIGQSNRWLAPIGAADLDQDGRGRFEVAYVDRPHLVKTIRVWRYEHGDLTLIGSLPGFTNHRIGERDIAGGVRHCAGVPEMIVADAGWVSVFAVRFSEGTFTTKRLGPHTGRDAFEKAMSCDPL